MKHRRVTAASFAAVLGQLAGIAASLAGAAGGLSASALPGRGVDVPFTERVISTDARGATSVFATDVDGDGDTDVLSASSYDDKIAWYESDGGSPPTFTERVISTMSDDPQYPDNPFPLRPAAQRRAVGGELFHTHIRSSKL